MCKAVTTASNKRDHWQCLKTSSPGIVAKQTRSKGTYEQRAKSHGQVIQNNDDKGNKY